MERGREFGRNVNPPQETETSPLEKARQKILDHLANTEVDSARFQAFGLYARTQLVESFHNDVGGIDAAIIAQQLKRKYPGFVDEYEKIGNIVLDYKKEVTEGLSDAREKWQVFAKSLYDISAQETKRRK